MAKQDRLENWHVLQDLAGVRKSPTRSASEGKSGVAVTAGEKATAPKSGTQPPGSGNMPQPTPTRSVSEGPKTAPAKANGNGKAHGDFAVGTRIKYNDGSAWVSGVVASVEPAVLKLDDNTVIQTSLDILLAGAAEGIIVRQ
jgi:hypothetical protein